MNLYDITVPRFAKMLVSIDRWIEKAIAHAEQKQFDPQVLFHARLAPDQWAFARQVQAACDGAKFAAAKLAGVEPPSHPDTEKTLDELRQRIRTCLAYLETFSRDDFAGADERACSHTWMKGQWMHGRDYALEFALPNFYFHAATAYAILRHNGVDLGKRHYIGRLTLHD